MRKNNLTSRKSNESSQGIELGSAIENDSELTSEVDGFLKEGKSSDNESISRPASHIGSWDEDLMHISILSRTSFLHYYSHLSFLHIQIDFLHLPRHPHHLDLNLGLMNLPH